MDEYRLQDIWKKNLRQYNDVLRLDAIIIKAMQEAAEEVRTEQCNIAGVSHRIPNQADISQVMKAFDPDRVGPDGESLGHLYYDWEVRELMKRYHRYGG